MATQPSPRGPSDGMFDIVANPMLPARAPTVEGLAEEYRRRVGVVDERERAPGTRPGDIREPALLLEGARRILGVGDRAGAREAALVHADDRDVVELEALRPVRGGEGEWRVVAAEAREAGAHVGDRGLQRRRGPGTPAPRRAVPRRFRGASLGRLRCGPPRAGRGAARRRKWRRARASSSSTSGDSTGSSSPAARNGTSSVRAATTAGRSSRLVRARIARVEGVSAAASRGHERSTATAAFDVLGRGWREDHGARRLGPCRDPLREALLVPLHEPDRSTHHGGRAPVVHRRGPRVGGRARTSRRGRAAAGRRRAASRRSTGRRRRRGRSGSPAPRAGAPSGAGSGRGPGPRRRGGGHTALASVARTEGSDSRSLDRPDDEVVEVEAAGIGERPLVRDEGPRRRTGVRVARRPSRHPRRGRA